MLRTWAFVIAAGAAPVLGAADELSDALRAAEAADRQRVEILGRAARAAVCMFANQERTGGGSGVVISPDGVGVTNYHVVGEMLPGRDGWGGLCDGVLYPLRVLGLDPGGDIALFKLSGKERFDFAPLGDSDTVRVGDWAAAIGNPFTLAEDYSPSITYGVVSGVRRYQYGTGGLLEYGDCIQVSTSINPGNSGGPLFDLGGRIIGINGRGSFEERGRVNVGLGYAVSVNQVRRFLPALRAGLTVEHGTLGATVTRAGETVIFDAIQDGSPANLAGVALGDELVSVAGRAIVSPNEYLNVLTTMPAGWPVRVVVRREGRTLELTARLARIPLGEAGRVPVDVKQGHDEIRRLLSLHSGAAASRRPAAVEWGGTVTVATVAGDDARRIEVRHEASGRLTVRVEGREFAIGSDGAATSDGTAGHTALNPAVWREWSEIVTPLVFGAKVTLGWEVVGGDEVMQRVASVVERRLEGGRRVRWKFDYDTGVLLSAATGDADEPERVAWTPGLVEGPYAISWSRSVAGEPATVVQWSSVRAEPPASGPSDAEPAPTEADARRPAPTTTRENEGAQPGGPDPVMAGVLARALPRVVKIYGSRIGREHAFGVGVVVSADGLIVTVNALLLEAATPRVVLADGTQMGAKVVARDELRQLALLKVDAAGLPYFEPGDASRLQPGDWLCAVGNPFKVAEGAEPLSCVAGALAGRVRLSGRHRAQEFPYAGAALLTDMVVSTPGFPGGPVVDARGEWVGLIGLPVIGDLTNTWINYALPVDEVMAFVRSPDAPPPPAPFAAGGASPGETGAELTAAALGIRLFELAGKDKPAYVDRVRPDSPAAAAGLRKDDLVVSVGGRPVGSCAEFHEALKSAASPLEVVVKRKDRLVTLSLKSAP